MEYRPLCSSGLKLSLFGFGTNIMDDRSKEDQYFAIFKKAYDLGINYFDTAEVYADGISEEILGKLIKRLNVPRENLVISTKLFRKKRMIASNTNPNSTGLSRKKIIEGMKNSLKRLQLGYVDILFCHRFDHETPLEETVRAVNWVISQGWALYWGTSEWSSEQIQQAYTICEKLNLIKPIIEQCQYNMLIREKFEVEFSNLFSTKKLSSIIFSPMCGGVLSGKYINGIPENSRNNDPAMRTYFWNPYYGANNEKKEKVDAILKKLQEFAENLGTSLPVLALAWTLKNKNVSCCLIGASKGEQLEENLKALEVYKILREKDFQEKIEEILGNHKL